MKVLFVSSGNSHYGIIPFVKSQGESLIKENIDLDFFTIQGKGVKGYLKNIKLLRNYLNDRKYDIIHAHYGLIGLLTLLTFSKIPIVLSVMGDDAYGDFDIKGRRIKSSYVGMLLTQITIFFVKKIIVKSKNILKVIPYKNKCHIVPNGVNFEVFKPFTNDISKNIVLFLADKNIERKNYKLFKEALNLLDDKNIKCICPYPIEHANFPNYLNKCSVFVLTSYNEGSPNVIKEAMACNIPIVSTDVGDVREVIGNTEGCFITSFNPEDVADKIREALEFKKTTTGREDIKHLESSVVAKRIINIYKEVLEK